MYNSNELLEKLNKYKNNFTGINAYEFAYRFNNIDIEDLKE